MGLLNTLKTKWLKGIFPSSDLKTGQKKEVKDTFDIIFEYSNNEKYSFVEAYAIIEEYIYKALERKDWYIRYQVDIEQINGKEHRVTVFTVRDANHPDAEYEHRKLKIDLDHVLRQSELKHYLSFISKYGVDFYDKVSVLSIKINLHYLFQVETYIPIYQIQKHRDDFLNKVWNDAKARLMKNPALSDDVENMDHHAIRMLYGTQAHADGAYAYITYRMFVTVDTPYREFLNDVTEALGEATKKYREHPYFTIYVNGDKYGAKASIENI